jgi:hypothetical protein
MILYNQILNGGSFVIINRFLLFESYFEFTLKNAGFFRVKTYLLN